MSSSSRASSSSLVGVAAAAAAAAAISVAVRRRHTSLRQATIDDNNNNTEDDDEERIYFDYNGTTPIYSQVLAAMMPYFTQHYGNASSGHWAGQEPHRAIDQARRQILQHLLQVPAPADKESTNEYLSSIWFTSCGTESDNLAIQLALQSYNNDASSSSPPHVITCNVEHPAVEGYLQVLQDQGKVQVTAVPVQPDGRVTAKDMIGAIEEKRQQQQGTSASGTTNIALVTLMLANNESGALQPVQQVAAYCRQHGIMFHTDAAQAAGKVSVSLQESLGGADLVSLVGHKMGAPKGVACLYVRPGCLNEAGRNLHTHGVMLVGGGQEHGRRAGTENVPYIVGMGQAAEMAAAALKQNAAHMEQLRRRLLDQLTAGLGKDVVRANGPTDPTERLPNTLSVGLRGVHSGDLLAAVGDRVAASAGATCHSAAGVSAVLQAMQVPPEFARGTLRLSVGPYTTAAQVDRAAAILIPAAQSQLQAAAAAAATAAVTKKQ